MNATEVFSRDSKTGYVYVKKNGEVINDYQPLGDSSPYLGQITIFAFNFAPHNWAQCNGQIFSIFSYGALFSLLGNYYGGNGTSTFALPDLRGRVPLSQGQGLGLSNYLMGEAAGSEGVTLIESELPAHNHSIGVNTGIGSSPNPSGKYIAANAEGINSFNASAGSSLNSGIISSTGTGNSHNNIQPILVLNFCIAMQGIFPAHG
ncbi:MAG: phage tail protein [Bacteroidetes bacterium]|nr:phage tail protein [Bacteroidota bacterium]